MRSEKHMPAMTRTGNNRTDKLPRRTLFGEGILVTTRTHGKRSSRHTTLVAVGGGLLGLTLPKLLAAEQLQPGRIARAKSVIFLFVFGGPPQ